MIPTDLIVEILSRLPAKSIARFCCVSKNWSFILCRKDFTDLFLKMSSARPRLLFILQLKRKFLFLSTPQPLYPDQNSSPIVLDHYMSVSTEDSFFGVTRPVCGWLCSKDKNPMICNPSTGQCITLPKVTLTEERLRVHTNLGYDPVDKLFKVLCVSKDGCRVLTFGNGEMSWRMIDCPVPHRPLRNGICINGVLYYTAASPVNGMPYPIVMGFGHLMLTCFDIRFEKFTFLAVDDPILKAKLINYNGKLGAVLPSDSVSFFKGSTTSLQLWVLDDAENQKWSKHIYVLPPLWRDVVGNKTMLHIVGMSGAGEFVFAPNYHEFGPYIFFYNVVRDTVIRVEIQLGTVASKCPNIDTFVDHVQDVKLMEALRRSS
ncbi:F-box protein DOR [Eutrema salsugineum]|nr:F-box protein DOR [Eutrema salsugineum]